MTGHPPPLSKLPSAQSQASLDSVHEKKRPAWAYLDVHIWPARRPLAACRAALDRHAVSPDSGHARGTEEAVREDRRQVVQKVEKKAIQNGKTVERIKEETGWHPALETGNRERRGSSVVPRPKFARLTAAAPPRVLDPFAGGGGDPAGGHAAGLRG